VGGDLCHEFTFLGGSPQDCDLVGTAHLVEIPVIMWNCAVDGSHPIGVTVKPRNFLGAASSVSEVTASIVCRSVYEVMRDLVDEMVASGEIALAGDHMRVFIHIIKQHIKKRPKRITGWAHKAPPKIDRDAGMFLIERAMLVVDCYLKLVPLCSDLSPRVH
jgi:hypothetical protein